jgi:hypothetical protein
MPSMDEAGRDGCSINITFLTPPLDAEIRANLKAKLDAIILESVGRGATGPG